MLERLNGKNVFLTGSTGFVGKVLLQKLLYSVQNIKTIYILIRGKKGSKLNQRFKKQIIGSACFDRLRKKHSYGFDNFIDTKIKPIQGDLLKDGIGFTNEDYLELSENINIIINCAASVDFNARLDDAINSNIKGALRVLEFSKKCKKLQIFTHVSTCYVNSNLSGYIKQQIYTKILDPQIQLKNLLELPITQLVRKTNQILQAYPNTYTYTKSLCQRLLKKYKDNIPLCIVRPSIINPSLRQPFQGWVDSIAASSALFLYIGIGLIKQVYGKNGIIGDMIPVDVVSDFIIVASAYNLNNKNLQIYNCGSSDRNPITWDQTGRIIRQYWNSNISQSKVDKATATIHENLNMINLRRFKRRIPVFLYSKVSNLIGNKAHIKNSEKFMKNLNRADEIQKLFRHFTSNQWIFESKNVLNLIKNLNREEKKVFNIDVTNINMKYLIMINNYGLQKYILKQNIDPPCVQNSNLFIHNQKNQTYFSDLKWAFKVGGKQNQSIRKCKEYKKLILNTGKVQQAIFKQIQRNNQFLRQQQKQFQINKLKVEKQAENMIQEMFGQFRMPVIRLFAWVLTKVFKKIYEKVNINQQVFVNLRKIQQKQIPIILAPTNKSYLDFLIVSYIFFTYKLKCPCVASDQSLMKMSLISFLLKSSGAFFIKKKNYKKSELYKAIFNAYIQIILNDGNNLEFFIEGTRSRTGKILEPQFQILSIIVESVIQQKIPDAQIVPLTINYQKVLQGDTFPFELLGQEKVEQSLLRLIKAVKLLKINLGRVYVQFCEPISIQKYIKNQISGNFNPLKKKQQRKQVVQRLGYYIVHRLTQKIVIMSTAIVSTILLMNRKGITEDLLIKNVHWLTKEILMRGYRVGGINQSSPNLAVRNSINHLQDITTKTKKSIFEIQISASQEYTKLLLLSYYRNALVHVFLPEAFIGFALNTFGSQLAFKQGVLYERVYEQTIFLISILKNQFITQKQIRNQQQFKSVLNRMISNKILIILQKQDNKQINNKILKIAVDFHNQRIINFYCSLLWPLIQSYCITITVLLSYLRNPQKIQEINYDKFLDYTQWTAESFYHQKYIDHYQSCSLETIRNSVKTFQSMEILNIRMIGKEKKIEIIASYQKLKQLENHLRNFFKNSKSLGSTDLIRSISNSEFQLIPKF